MLTEEMIKRNLKDDFRWIWHSNFIYPRDLRPHPGYVLFGISCIGVSHVAYMLQRFSGVFALGTECGWIHSSTRCSQIVLYRMIRRAEKREHVC
jgi:hypothetical protein